VSKMFRIEKIELRNFRSYRGEHTWTLPKEGLFFITGRNDLYPGLDRNGTGKSTLLDAIMWCFYGRTLRGLKASDVHPHGEVGTTLISIDFTIGAVVHKLIRTQAPNSLILDGAHVTQKEVTDLLRMGPEAFTYSVIKPQFGDSFFDLSPGDKLALFSEIMNLDEWLEKSKLAASETTRAEEAIHEVELKIASTESRYESIGLDIANLTEKSASFDKDVSKRKKELKAKSKETMRLVMEAERVLKQHRKARMHLAKDLKQAHKKIEVAEATLKSVEKEYWAVKDKQTRLELKDDELKFKLDGFRGVTGTCPTCLQEVDMQHLEAEKKKLLEARAEIFIDLTSVKELLVGTDKVLAQAEKDIENRRDEMILLNKEDITHDRAMTGVERQIERYDTEFEHLDAEIKKADVNPYEAMLKAKSLAWEQCSSRLIDLNEDLAAAREDHASVSYWVQGFKRLRLMLVEDTLRSLEIEVNSSLASLGLPDWRVSFDVERENKSGGVTKGFTVAIHSPDNEAPVPWAAWSGGESKLLSLAGALGLSNLIMERAGLTNMVEFFDEPSTHTAPAGIAAMAATLRERAHTTGRAIFLIDHNSIDSGEFDGVITIVRDKEGSHIR
jgi:DNA repair exonuclease SbcCD ATPase subunit